MIKTEKDALYYYSKIESLKQQGLWWQVVDVYEKVLSLIFKPKRELLLEYIFYLKKMNRFAEIVKVYQQVELIAPLNSEEAFDYAYALEYSGKKELSYEFYQQAIDLDRSKNAKLFGKSVFYEALGDWSGASKAYKESFKDKKLSLQMAYKQGMAYDRCYKWEEAEKTYLDAILKSDEEVNFYHRLGIVQERLKKYDEAIESYFVAVSKSKNHSSYFYYRLGYVLQKKEYYKEACEAFLMMKKKYLDLEGNKSQNLEQESGIVLHQYLIKNEPLNLSSWIEFAKKAENLKAWKVAEYAYREYLSREENFKENIYFLLAYTLVQQERYKDAVEIFLEQRIIQDAHGLVESEYKNNKRLQKSINYTEYYERFELDNQLIVYESYLDNRGNSAVLKIFKTLKDDVHFDNYRHIWISNMLEELPIEIQKDSSVVVVSRESDLYMRYLAKAKYILNNTLLPDYFIQKEGQYCLDNYSFNEENISQFIKSIFFQNNIFSNTSREKISILFYAGAFIPNGITTSFLNLLTFLDKEKYTIYLVIEEEKINAKSENIEQFNRLSKDVNIIKKTSSMLLTLEEKWLITKLNSQHKLASKEMYERVNSAYYREYKRVFKKVEFDLVINFEGYSQYWLRVLGSVKNIPSVLYLHNDIVGEATVRFPYLFANMKSYENYTKLISVSKDSNVINKKKLNIKEACFEYCNNILNAEEIIVKSQENILNGFEKEIFNNSRVFINVARLSPEKDQVKLIRAFYRLSQDFDDIKLVIIGQGPLHEKLMELIKDLYLEEKVFLLGQKFNPMPYIKAANCFVLSSNHEGQGLVLFEAMILNKPVISTDIEGPASVLANNLGKLVDNSDDGLYLGMLEFLSKDSFKYKSFDAYMYNKNALEQFSKNVLSLAAKQNSLDLLYQSAIEDFENEKWDESLRKFQKVKTTYKLEDNRYPLRYYLKEAEFRVTLHKEGINEDIFYVKHLFSAENFVGIKYLLNKLSHQSKNWENLYIEFLNIIEYVKTDDNDMKALVTEEFILYIRDFSKSLNNQLEAEKLPHKVWFVFANLFLLAREYNKYYLARENALNSILSVDKIPNVRVAQYKLTAMAEANKVDEYDNLKDNLLKKDLGYIKQHLQLLGNTELYFGRKELAVEFYKKLLTPEEKDFSSYVQDKSIAIVGPVNSGLNVGEDINSYDIVLRFNYMGTEKLDNEKFGNKTDISFYIEARLWGNKIESKKISRMNELDWIIIDSPHSIKDISFTGVTKPIRQRYLAAHPFANPLLKGAPSGIQRAIMDLMRFNVKKIKVFNTNLFLENNYDKNYASRGKLGVDYFNFHWHDPLGNFLFLKRLESFGLIEVDEVLQNILRKSKKEYIEALELQYGNKN